MKPTLKDNLRWVKADIVNALINYLLRIRRKDLRELARDELTQEDMEYIRDWYTDEEWTGYLDGAHHTLQELWFPQHEIDLYVEKLRSIQPTENQER